METSNIKYSDYNCAQKVAFALYPFVKDKIDKETLFKVTEGLGGGGCGTHQGTCGALSGAQVIIGLAISSANLENPNSKSKTYDFGFEISNSFQKELGSYICGPIKKANYCDKAIEVAISLATQKLKLLQ